MGTFDDDLALMWLEGAMSAPGLEALERTLGVGDGYLERATCVTLLGAAEIVAGTLRGPRPGLPSVALRVIESLDPSEVAKLRALAARQVRRVLGAQSELREYWDESDQLFPVWRANVLELCRRLEE